MHAACTCVCVCLPVRVDDRTPRQVQMHIGLLRLVLHVLLPAALLVCAFGAGSALLLHGHARKLSAMRSTVRGFARSSR